ncbi:hypothetical protein GIB67_002512 [Kingdonia uniflora]|uniref:GTD-binding domain-containing protein n=1 Tax=Kingdonia uniflora TaxID=39325 RepID=A0A7J7N8N7_9MAGN|nr:hypothetical protein GIB67_002512 [Kingdonia uniflora]
MAANKFATMLHNKTNKPTVILVYAILEWVLIILLLLNSFFWYLITVFAEYFGLKPPCIWCSRVDHILDPKKSKNSNVCEKHSTEISKLAYCSSHGKLAESNELCEDCSSSKHVGGKVVTISLVEEISNDSERNWRICSCCKLSFSREVYSPYVLIKPSWGILDYTQKENLIEEAPDESGFTKRIREEKGVSDSDSEEEHEMFSDGEDCLRSCKEIEMDGDHVVESIGDDSKMVVEGRDDVFIRSSDASLELISSESFSDRYDHRIFPIELIDDTTLMTQSFSGFQEFKSEIDGGFEELKIEEHGEPISENKTDICENDVFSVSHAEEQNMGRFAELFDQVAVENLDAPSVFEEKELLLAGEESNSDSLISGEAFHQEPIKYPENCVPISSATCPQEDPSFLSEEDVAQGEETNSDSLISGEAFHQEPINYPEDCVPISSATCPQEDQSFLSEEDVAQGEETNSDSLISGEAFHQEPINYPEDCVPISSATCPQEDQSFLSEEDVAQGEETNSDSLISGEPSHEEPINYPEDCEHISSATCPQEDQSFLSEEDVAQDEETNSDSLISGETSHQEPINYPEDCEHISSATCPQEDHFFLNEGDVAQNSISSDRFTTTEGPNENEEVAVLSRTMFVGRDEQGIINHNLSIRPEVNYVEDDKVPETPTYVGYIHHLHKKFLVLDKKESGAEESLDGSLISEVDGEGVLTSDRLRSAMRALYTELEEERNASTIAANETMAMITRLQEEKASMQMEALHYQRMMEEQSEYDQEALQLLNELMVKREKEKQELEGELETLRNKVLYYETKGTTSKTSSLDDDEHSICHDREGVDEYVLDCYEDRKIKNTPTDTVLDLGNILLESAKHMSTLHESLANFEEERQSILDQLKALEGKLFTLGEDEEEFTENGFENHDDHVDVNGFSDGFGRNYHEERGMGLKAKRLLPLFDAVENENEEELLNNGSNCASSDEKLAIEEEVGHLYERLQALEADREFLNHCVSSMKKGDKGMNLLQEILQHLRDLRSVELRAKNSANGGDHTFTEINER